MMPVTQNSAETPASSGDAESQCLYYFSTDYAVDQHVSVTVVLDMLSLGQRNFQCTQFERTAHKLLLQQVRHRSDACDVL